MKTLRIADRLSIPLDVVTQKLAWLGVTGSGKTYGASKLAELLWDAHAQIVVLDPVGVWWGLRLDRDGKQASDVTIPIFGGLHGDLPLEPSAGALVANLVVDRGISMIIDVSQFESDAQKARFGTDFAERFFFRKKAAPSAVHLFVEEAQEFVPQNTMKGEERMLHAFTRLQKLGRNFGIGSSFISQRPQEVNKKALNMAQTLFVFRTTGSQERDAIEKWIADKALDQDIAGDLPKLKTGDCHVWSPEWLGVSEVVRISEKRTFNASSTPEVGVSAKARELAGIDLEQIRGDMAATIERAKADDPGELKKKIAALERELKKAQTAAAPPDEREIERRVKVRLDDETRHLKQQLEQRDERIATMAKSADETLRHIVKELGVKFSPGPAPKAKNILVSIPNSKPQTAEPLTPRPMVSSRTVAARDDNGDLPAGERAVLTAIAQHTDGVTREQLTILTGYKRSTRDLYLQKLGRRGYIGGNGLIVATDEGLEALGSDFQPLPTGDALREHWLTKLPVGERVVFEAVVASWPKPLSRDDISAATNYQRSTRDLYIQKLGRRRLVTADRDGVRASDMLFG
jgi:hypothetical protein